MLATARASSPASSDVTSGSATAAASARGTARRGRALCAGSVLRSGTRRAPAASAGSARRRWGSRLDPRASRTRCAPEGLRSSSRWRARRQPPRPRCPRASRGSARARHRRMQAEAIGPRGSRDAGRARLASTRGRRARLRLPAQARHERSHARSDRRPVRAAHGEIPSPQRRRLRRARASRWRRTRPGIVAAPHRVANTRSIAAAAAVFVHAFDSATSTGALAELRRRARRGQHRACDDAPVEVFGRRCLVERPLGQARRPAVAYVAKPAPPRSRRAAPRGPARRVVAAAAMRDEEDLLAPRRRRPRAKPPCGSRSSRQRARARGRAHPGPRGRAGSPRRRLAPKARYPSVCALDFRPRAPTCPAGGGPRGRVHSRAHRRAVARRSGSGSPPRCRPHERHHRADLGPVAEPLGHRASVVNANVAAAHATTSRRRRGWSRSSAMNGPAASPAHGPKRKRRTLATTH